MNRNSWIIFCLAYVIGLLSANWWVFPSSGFDWHKLGILATGLIGLAIVIAIAAARFHKSQYKLWLSAGIVGVMAVVYFQLRIPQPSINDISYQVSEEKSEFVTVTGKILTEPRLTASQKLKFWLQTTEIEEGEEVSGKLYVTVPLLLGTGIYPGKNLSVKGILYLPKSSHNPGSFDFKAYLARQGTFAGLQGLEIIAGDNNEPVWGWWKLRRRIVRSHLRGLGSPVGQLVSSMVLGRKAVDLSGEIRERFIGVGLAHVLAASGFHVSLLLGIVLKLTNRFSPRSRLVIGVSTLVGYLGLTGLQPSVLRAVLMGIGVLIAIAMNAKVKPLGSLLLAATIILGFDPLLIGDVGFQLSFLATLGLIVTLPALQAKLDWIPPTIATLIAVPLAASIWVLPLLSYVFNVVATYSIIVNIVATPLIAFISLGGMVSAIAALIIPALGSAIAWILFYPTLLLIGITRFFTNLPGSSWAIGSISLSALLGIYTLFGLVWLSKWWQKRWWLALLLAIALIILPIGYSKFNLVKVTVLAAKQEQVVVIQDRGKVILINSGKASTAKYTVLPFLAQQGINRIDYAIALERKSSFEEGWWEISSRLAIDNFVSNLISIPTMDANKQIDGDIVTNSLQISVNNQLSTIYIQFKLNNWLIVGNNDNISQAIAQYIPEENIDNKPLILFWSGKSFTSEWLERLQPKVAIASNNRIEENTLRQLQQQQIRVYRLNQDGAVQWTPEMGFKTTLDMATHNNTF